MTAVPPLTGAPDDDVLLPLLLQAAATRASVTTPTPAASNLPRRLNLDLPCRSADDFIVASP
jgi:hypothetical protein